jgi:NUMOD3 motif
MNYTLHYTKLIERAKSEDRRRYTTKNTKYVYYEKHHIIPKCMGGSNAEENLILLTPEEHYLAHLLLIKMHKDHAGLTFAAIKLTRSTKNGKRMNNKLYSWLRKQHAENTAKLHKDKKCGMHGKKHSEITKNKMRENNYFNNGGKQLKGEDSPSYGLKRSQETCSKISEARIGVSTGKRTEETKQKMRVARKLQTKTSQKEMIVFGIKYSSLKEACLTLNRNHRYIIHRLKSDKFPDCYYL